MKGYIMIEAIKGLPDNVIGMKISGTVKGEDYEKVLIPAVEEKLKQYDKIRFLYQVGEDFDHYEFKAMIEDTKVGLGHFFAWDRIAVVTDVEWISQGVRAFGFAMPAKVKVFSNSELDAAKAWLSEKRKGADISVDNGTGIAIFRPEEPLDKSDFERAGSIIDPFIENYGDLKGLIIYTKTFPGYDSAGAFSAHIHFIKTHHKHIEKLALVTDSKAVDMVKSIASHFVDIDVRQFPYDELEAAKTWITS